MISFFKRSFSKYSLAVLTTTGLLCGAGFSPALASNPSTATPSASSSSTPATTSATPQSASSTNTGPTQNTSNSSSSSFPTTSTSSSSTASTSSSPTPANNNTRKANTTEKPAETSVDANAVVSGNVTVTNKVLYDGTGYGNTGFSTNLPCALNSANGFVNGDENANDGIVCSGDTIGYRTTFAVTASDQPTTIDVVYSHGGTFDPNDPTSLCASDVGGAYIGTLIQSSIYPTPSIECKYVVKANTSITFNKDSFSTVYFTEKTDQLNSSFTVNGGTSQNVLSDSTKVIFTPATNFFWSPLNRDDNNFNKFDTITKNGQDYYRYSYVLNYNDGFGKGTGSINNNVNVSINLNNIPSNAEISDDSGLTYSNNTLSGSLVKNKDTIYIDIPTNSLPPENSSWSLNLTQVNATSSSDYPYYYNNNSEPGVNQPVDYDSGKDIKFDAFPYKNYGFRNDDWAGSTFTTVVPQNIPIRKTVQDLNNNVIDYNTTQRPNTLLNDILYINPANVVATPNMKVCDRWDYNTQNFDPTRDLIVKVGSTVITNYTIYYNESYCGQNNNTSYMSNTHAIQIVFNDSIDLSQGVTIQVPMKLDDYSSFPNFPQPQNVADIMSVNFTNPNLASSDVQAVIRVAGPYVDLNSITFIKSSLDNAIVQKVTAGSNYLIDSTYSVTPHDYKDGDPTSQPLTASFQMPICATNIGNPSIDHKDAVNWNITPGNYGPDGIPCTSDDISGDVVNVTMQWDTNTHLYEGIRIPFTIAPYAVQGKTMNFVNKYYILNSDRSKTITTTENDNIVTVINNSTVGQSKITDVSKAPVGNTIGWKTIMFNNTSSAVGSSAFIDILPYNGDSRGTKLNKPLSQISIDTSGLTNDTIYVTTADPNTLNADVTNAANNPSNNSLWCLYGSTSCPSGGNYTAILYEFTSIDAMAQMKSHITASTTGENDGDIVYNNLGIGNVSSLNLPVYSTNNVETDLYIPNANLSFSKVASKSNARIGDTINYTLTLKNIGSTDLNNIQISDPTCSNLTEVVSDPNDPNVLLGDVNNDGLFNAGETHRYTCNHVVSFEEASSGSYINTATATATTTDPNVPNPSINASAITALSTTKIPTVISGYVYDDNNLNFTKDDTEGSYFKGSINVVRLIDINGNVLATSNTNFDTGYYEFPNLSINVPVRVTFTPQDNWGGTPFITQEGSLNATSPTTTAYSQTINPGQNSTNVNFGVETAPTISINQSEDKSAGVPGDIVNYTITVQSYDETIPFVPHITNSGCENLTYMSGDTNSNGLVDPGEVFTYTCTHTLTNDDMSSGSYNNTTNVIGDFQNPVIPNPTASTSSTVSNPQAGIVVVKLINNDYSSTTSPGVTVPVGSTMKIMYMIQNLGNVPLYNVKLTDNLISSDNIQCYTSSYGGPSLAPNKKSAKESTIPGWDTWDGAVLPVQNGLVLCESTYPAPAINEQHVNHATVTATSPYATDPVTSSADAYAHSVNASLTKTVDKTNNIAVGDILTYTIKQTFDGDGIYVNMNDSGCDNISTPDGDTNGNGTLEHDETWVWTCTHTVTQDDIDAGSYKNVATSYLSDYNQINLNMTAEAISSVQPAVSTSNIQINTCYNTNDCATPATNIPTILDATTQATDNTGTTIYNNLIAGSNHDLVVNPPAGMQVSDVLVDGVSVGTAIPSSVAAPDSGTRIITIVYVPITVSVPTSSADNPVFDSGI